MGKMRELLESKSPALVGILGNIEIYIANDDTSPTLCKVTIVIGDRKYARGASIGQLRTLAKETARAVNNLLEIQGISPHRKITVDGETPL